jgi:hypothetical protein
MPETSDLHRCRSTEAVTCWIESGCIGDRKPVEHKHAPNKERESGRRGEKAMGQKKARGVSNKSQFSCSFFMLVSLSL